MSNKAIIEDDGDDSAPEDVSFSASKQTTIEGLHKIKEHVCYLERIHFLHKITFSSI
jgi:hypothetical protein